MLKGTAADPNGIRRVEYALQGGGPAGPEPAFLPVEAGQPLEGGFAFEAPLDLAALPDGDVALTVRATDAAGRASESTLRFMKDTVGPAVALLTPLQGDAVNGRITVTGTVADEGRVERVEFSDDGSTFTPVEGTGVFTLPLDLSRYPVLPEAFTFRATDRGGNTTLFTPTLNVQQATDIPVVQIQIPQEGETLRNDFIISGMVFDDDGVGSISYRIDEGEFVQLPGSNGFSIPVAIADIADNGHTIEVKAEDLNAVPSEARTSTFRISKAEPTAKITAPPIDLTARDLITLEGEAADRNGIEEVFVSYDNGRTFDRCEGQEKWTYRLDTRILKDGTYSVLVRPVDAYGTEGLYTTLLNIDNAGPQIILDTPADGVAVTGSLPLDGRAWDNIRLTALKATLQPLGGEAAAGGTGPETPQRPPPRRRPSTCRTRRSSRSTSTWRPSRRAGTTCPWWRRTWPRTSPRSPATCSSRGRRRSTGSTSGSRSTATGSPAPSASPGSWNPPRSRRWSASPSTGRRRARSR